MNETRSKEPDAILTIDDTAELLKVSARTIRTWMHDRKLPHKKLDRTVRFSRAALGAIDAYFAAHGLGGGK